MFGLGSLRDDYVGLAGATPQLYSVAPYTFDYRFVDESLQIHGISTSRSLLFLIFYLFIYLFILRYVLSNSTCNRSVVLVFYYFCFRYESLVDVDCRAVAFPYGKRYVR